MTNRDEPDDACLNEHAIPIVTRCWLCGRKRKCFASLFDTFVCEKCWRKTKRRPGREVGAEIHDGLAAMKADRP
jgi:hypothetical protein